MPNHDSKSWVNFCLSPPACLIPAYWWHSHGCACQADSWCGGSLPLSGWLWRCDKEWILIVCVELKEGEVDGAFCKEWLKASPGQIFSTALQSAVLLGLLTACSFSSGSIPLMHSFLSLSHRFFIEWVLVLCTHQGKAVFTRPSFKSTQ